MTRKLIFLLLTAALLIGCGTSFPPFTEDSRTTIDLPSAVFHLSAKVNLRSLHILEPLDTKGPVQERRTPVPDRLPNPTRAASLAQGAGWITVDFGRGIILRFESTDKGTYATPGWGTLTVEGERYDVNGGHAQRSRKCFCFWRLPDPVSAPGERNAR